MRPLSKGKLPIEVLSSTFLRLTGAHSDAIATPPGPGLDFAALKAGAKYMIVSSDPITGVVEEIGRYAMHVNANDVATSGNPPQFAESVVLLPEGADVGFARKIARQLDAEARRLGISIVGGHTEVTPGLGRPMVVVTAFSFVERYVSSGDAKAGDSIMMTKTAGLEGTAALTGSKRLLDSISIVPEAVSAFRTGYVHAMHDCTEGGALGATFEMSLASGVGFVLEESKVPVSKETAAMCTRRKIDPLKLIGSGSLLLAVEEGHERQVTRAVSPVSATVVGRFVPSGRTLVRSDGRREDVLSAPEDELWRFFGRPSGRGHGL